MHFSYTFDLHIYISSLYFWWEKEKGNGSVWFTLLSFILFTIKSNFHIVNSPSCLFLFSLLFFPGWVMHVRNSFKELFFFWPSLLNFCVVSMIYMNWTIGLLHSFQIGDDFALFITEFFSEQSKRQSIISLTLWLHMCWFCWNKLLFVSFLWYICFSVLN